MYAPFVTRHTKAIVQFLPYSAQQVRCGRLHSHGNSVLQIRYAHRLWWHKHFVLHVTPKELVTRGYVKDKMFVPPQPVSVPDLKNRITAAVETITPDLLSGVWQELDCRLDVCRVTKGAYIEYL